ncbi:hypothetical protein BH23CYA1_BH23CYA1_16120 [soil metagenome]|uniref:CsbD family protein n=1 Tax=Leptolyngbya sp. BC1307 TaxID=2029589 RepID=UPI000EFCAE53|nr:CsbD family protein [Leptolyngbya sp. BC1307]
MSLEDKAKAAAKATEGKLKEAYGRAQDNPEAQAEGEDEQIEAAALVDKEDAKTDIKDNSK